MHVVQSNGHPVRRLFRRLTLLGSATAVLSACAPPHPGPPSFLLVTIDTARADRFGFEGGEDGLTPNADRLARESTVFTDCVSPMGTTSPAHATLMTGYPPRSHGVRTNTMPLASSAETLAEILSAHGWKTGAFVGMKMLLSHGGLDQGFDALSDAPGTLAEEGIRNGRETVELAGDWFERLGAEGSAPFFAWVHFYEPHSPYEMTDRARRRLPDYTGAYAEGISVMDFTLGRWLERPGDRALVRSLYDDRVLDADARMGELLERLGSLHQLANTVVIVASDHGQALGEHGRAGHGPMLGQSVLHVPLLVWDSRSRIGRRVDERVGLIDLAPTVIDLAGLAVRAGLEGRSLVPALRGEPLASRPYLSEVRKPRRSGVFESPPVEIAVFDGRFKLLSGRVDVLIDLELDPGELNPIRREDRPEVYERLTRLAREYASRKTPEPGAPIPGEVVEQLRALGYEQ